MRISKLIGELLAILSKDGDIEVVLGADLDYADIGNMWVLGSATRKPQLIIEGD